LTHGGSDGGGPPHIVADCTWNLYLLVGITVAFLEGEKKLTYLFFCKNELSNLPQSASQLQNLKL
jgi:hypothetical protein